MCGVFVLDFDVEGCIAVSVLSYQEVIAVDVFDYVNSYGRVLSGFQLAGRAADSCFKLLC